MYFSYTGMCNGMYNRIGPGHNYRTEVEDYESTVYRTLLFHNSCFLRTLEKNLLSTYS